MLPEIVFMLFAFIMGFVSGMATAVLGMFIGMVWPTK